MLVLYLNGSRCWIYLVDEVSIFCVDGSCEKKRTIDFAVIKIDGFLPSDLLVFLCTFCSDWCILLYW